LSLPVGRWVAGFAVLGVLGVAVLIPMSTMALLGVGTNNSTASLASCGQVGSQVGVPGSGSLTSGGEVVGASEYGGPGDPTTPGDNGAYGPLAGHYAFAELSTNWAAPSGWDFSALGGLAPGTLLQISYQGRSVIAQKLDVGRGGPPVGQPSHARAIDLWYQTAEALGFQGTGLVEIAPAPPGTPVSASLVPGGQGQVGGTALSGTQGCAASSFAGASTIVAIADSQVGVRANPPGSDCSPYGPCEEWCALFATWVWRKAGVDIPSEAFTGAVYDWAAANGRILPPSATPSPGDVVFFGTGPSSTTTSKHMGVVTQVTASGEIVEVDGNYGGQVARVGPYAPADPASAGEPGPIYAYAQPSP
jgi:hypothetical protein